MSGPRDDERGARDDDRDAAGPPSAHEPAKKPEQPGLSDLPGVAAFAVMGSTIATCLGVGVVLGLGADRAWHTAPWGLILGIVLGTVAAVVSVVKLVRRFL